MKTIRIITMSGDEEAIRATDERYKLFVKYTGGMLRVMEKERLLPGILFYRHIRDINTNEIKEVFYTYWDSI